MKGRISIFLIYTFIFFVGGIIQQLALLTTVDKHSNWLFTEWFKLLLQHCSRVARE
jgi:hypothetical protein